MDKNWLLQEQNYHINIDEMVAVQFGLKYFAGEYMSVTFPLNIVNTTVVSMLKNKNTPIIICPIEF